MSETEKKWDVTISADQGAGASWLAILGYTDLIFLFVRRDFTAFYKQTLLGPIWYLIQPVVNSLVFTIVFGKFAGLPTEGSPGFLFYLSGNVVWLFFTSCVRTTSSTFVENAGMFGKVYFPRMVVPIANILTNLIQFGIQFALFCFVFTYYWIDGFRPQLGMDLLLIPALVIYMGVFALGVGNLLSSLTAKYRDLSFAMNFGIQLWMYATPIVYPLSQVPEGYRLAYALNPMVGVVELFRHVTLRAATVRLEEVAIGMVVTVVIGIVGFMRFSKVERTFLDTV